MRRAGWWILAGAVALLALVSFVALSLRRDRKGARGALADAIEAWHAPKLRAATEKADALAAKYGEQTVVVGMAKKRVDDLKAELETKFFELSLTPEEIQARFSKLKV